MLSASLQSCTTGAFYDQETSCNQQGASSPLVGAGNEQSRKSSSLAERGGPAARLSANHLVQYQSSCLSRSGFALHSLSPRAARKTIARIPRRDPADCAWYLQTERVSLTQRHIARYLAQPAILRDPKVRELLREVCREVETRNGEKLL